MARKILAITSDVFKILPDACKSCAYWESSKGSWEKQNSGSLPLKKKWYRETLSEWGECGKVFISEKETLAYIQYAPPFYFPRVSSYPLKVSEDAIFLSCLFVREEFRGRGLAKLLLRAAVKDLYQRGYQALEAFAYRGGTKAPLNPLEFYLRNGFYIVRNHRNYSLVRLDFKSLIPISESLESLLKRLILPSQKEVPSPL